MTEADRIAHPIGSSVYDIGAQSSACVLEVTRLTYGKVEEEGASLTEDEIETAVFTDPVQASADTVGPI